MNKDNMEISAISYTNKDFGSIYPEILDIAKQLTNEWDPSNSNESDPGVVLLKEAAFVADHNNYNIDKNILENFLPSATQDVSVRNICEMNGYTPRYYTSAIGDISFNWTPPEEEKEMATSFTIPAFTLVVSDADETVSYTQIENLVVNDKGVVSCKFIEGTLQTLVINNSSVITLQDLDDNNRVYFPEVMVAQNRVYVRNYNSEDESRLLQEEDYWVRDNYLLTRPSGTKVFKVDYDSILDLPYIEFPTDISSIIGDGVVVEYISTSGKAGNINANTISKILSPSTFYAIGEDTERSISAFSVFNSGSITNGKDPETIDEMYRSFKKIIGTFDTLVSCRDYSNSIYVMTDGDGNPLVSNAYVTDRRIDYNKSINVVSYDFSINTQGFANLSIKPCSLNFLGATQEKPEGSTPSGNPGDMLFYDGSLYVNMSTVSTPNWQLTNTINLNDFAILTEAMTPYDLAIYALRAFSLAEYNSLAPELAYNKSFEPVSSTTLKTIKNDLELNKSLCHTYDDPSSGDVFIFKNYVPLNVELEPYNKVKSTEEAKILDNIYKALSEEFNPRNLEFGEKLDVDTLKKIIIGADSRIKNAKINPLEYETFALTMVEGKWVDKTMDSTISTGGATFLVDLIAKNVLAGRICLFNFDNNFKFDYGQQGIKEGTNFISINKNVNDIKSETIIKIDPSNDQQNVDVIGENITRIGNKYTIKGFSNDRFNYRYNFNAPNFVNSEDERLDLLVYSSYELQTSDKGTDKFTIYKYDPDNTANITKIEFESKNDVKYTIVNMATKSNDHIKNVDSDEIFSLAEDDSIEIMIDTINNDYGRGPLNLDTYTLNQNEYIQILSPNYISDITYSMYVNYRYSNIDTSGFITANTDHTLQTGEEIVLLYTQDGVDKQVTLTSGEVVNANFNIYPTDNLTTNVSKKEWVDSTGEARTSNFRQLTSNQTISTRKLMQTKLSGTDIWCYWIVDKKDSSGRSILFDTNDNEIILNNNEYFIYTNSSLNEMIILGAGTKLTKPVGSDSEWWVLDDQDITIESITKYGTSINQSISWKKGIDFAGYPMYITEMSVITLSEGDWLSIYGWDEIEEREKDETLNSTTYINSDWIYCDGVIMYKNSSSEDIVTLPKIDHFYEIRSRLDLNMSSEHPQMLHKTVDTTIENNIISVDRVILRPDSSSEIIIESIYEPIEDSEGTIIGWDKNDVYIQSSEPMYKVGGRLKIDENNFYHYTLIKDDDGNITRYQRTFVIGNSRGSASYDFFCDQRNSLGSGTYLIPVHISGKEVPIKVKANVTGDATQIINLQDFNSDTLPKVDDWYILYGTQSYYLKLEGSEVNNVTLEFAWDYGTTKENESVIVGDITVFDGQNKNLKPEDKLDDILARMKEIISGSDKPSTKYYYAYKPDNSIIMDNTDFNDINAMWDVNNIINGMILPQIDIANSNIKVISSMKRD